MNGAQLAILATALLGSIALANPVAVAQTDALSVPKFPPTYRYNKDEKDYRKLPKRSELPVIAGNPKGSAWLWGDEDDLGRVNFVTPARVRKALEASKSGEVIPLNVGIYSIDPPFFQRPKFNYTAIPYGDGSLPVFDDHLEMNTQTASQIDGFRHFGHLETDYFYNGCTQGDVIGPNANLRCGMQALAEHGIVGRAIFVDVGAYYEKKGLTYPILEPHNITLRLLKEAAASQGTDLRRVTEGGHVMIGDYLVVRTGFMKQYLQLTPEEKAAYASRADVGWTGLEASQEMMDFTHDSYFSGVFADNPSAESWPLPANGVSLHESLLALWGVPIGEFWYLEEVSQKCASNKRYKFLVSSAPFNIDGGIASWANALAIL